MNRRIAETILVATLMIATVAVAPQAKRHVAAVADETVAAVAETVVAPLTLAAHRVTGAGAPFSRRQRSSRRFR
jgi:hypothetical protein